MQNSVEAVLGYTSKTVSASS